VETHFAAFISMAVMWRASSVKPPQHVVDLSAQKAQREPHVLILRPTLRLP
jgi:hypothetical protein